MSGFCFPIQFVLYKFKYLHIFLQLVPIEFVSKLNFRMCSVHLIQTSMKKFYVEFTYKPPRQIVMSGEAWDAICALYKVKSGTLMVLYHTLAYSFLLQIFDDNGVQIRYVSPDKTIPAVVEHVATSSRFDLVPKKYHNVPAVNDVTGFKKRVDSNMIAKTQVVSFI